MLGWNNDGAPSSFLVDGNRISSPKEMANIQVDCFVNKAKKLRESLPITEGDPHWLLKTALKKWGRKAGNREVFFLQEISLLQTANIIKKTW